MTYYTLRDEHGQRLQQFPDIHTATHAMNQLRDEHDNATGTATPTLRLSITADPDPHHTGEEVAALINHH